MKRYNEIGDYMEEKEYLECEKFYIFLLLVLVGGFYGAYTFTLKGGVFCNAQTANVVLFGMALGTRNVGRALYLLIPISSYFLGTMLSEHIAYHIKNLGILRWDTALIGIEMLIIAILGFLPDSTPVQVFQVSINFICAMQFNTFRQAESIPMATTFVTNHIRQTGSFLVKWMRKKDEKAYLNRALRHFGMLGMFTMGAAIGALLCLTFKSQTIWFALIVLGIVFIDLLHADLVVEKELLDRVPKGH